MSLYTNKVAMITGGGSGIGRATCLLFAAEGASVVVADMNEAQGTATADAIHAEGGKAIFVAANVGIESDMQNVVNCALSEYGRLDAASNNAALSVGSALLADTDADDFRKTYDITLNGVFYSMKYQIPAMLENGGGAIVNIGSKAALSPNVMMSAYDSAKAAVNSITRSAAKEYARQGIRVNCINPGVVRTEGIEKYLATDERHEARFLRGIAMNRLANPSELAEVVIWLCSDKSSYVTGQSLSVDGGMLS